jgi:hypothetical protein
VWADDPRSAEVIGRAKSRGLKLITVGEAGETIQLVSRSSTPLGQTLILSHAGQEHRLTLPLIGAYQAANVLGRGGTGACDRRRVGCDPAWHGAGSLRSAAGSSVPSSTVPAHRSMSTTPTRPMQSTPRSPRFGRMSPMTKAGG